MSLKAKIEAIIYATEEPVTLQQLQGLLGGEAQTMLDTRAEQQRRLPLGKTPGEPTIPLPSEPDLLNDEVLDYPDLDEDEDGSDAAGELGPPPAQPAVPADDPPSEGAAEAQAETANAKLDAPPPDEKQLQRAARERERAVRELLREQIDALIHDYATGDRGLEIREVAGGFRLATRPEYHDAVRGFARSLKPPLKLSLQALETLAVVAYKQPITAPEVAEIRGVDSGGVLGSLMARKLIVPAGRKQVVGRPILYRTTKEFLLRFGLRDVHELPSIEEFEKLAGELADTEPLQEEIRMSTTGDTPSITAANLREEENAAEPQADGDPGGAEITAAIPVDGRLSGLLPTEEPPIDSPAGDAAIQADQQAEYAAENGTED